MSGNLLVYHGKHSDHYWLIDTPARHDAAMVALFQLLDEFGCYHSIDNKKCLEALAVARSGNLKFIKAILESHNGYEYESWDIEYAEDATERGE